MYFTYKMTLHIFLVIYFFKNHTDLFLSIIIKGDNRSHLFKPRKIFLTNSGNPNVINLFILFF